MTDSKENLSKPESASESKSENENKVETRQTSQKPRRGQSRAIPQAIDKEKLKYNF